MYSPRKILKVHVLREIYIEIIRVESLKDFSPKIALLDKTPKLLGLSMTRTIICRLCEGSYNVLL